MLVLEQALKRLDSREDSTVKSEVENKKAEWQIVKKVPVVMGKGLQAVAAQAGREPEARYGFCKGLNISFSQLSMNEEYLASVRQMLGGREQIGSSRTEGPGEAWLCIVVLSRHLFILVGPCR